MSLMLITLSFLFSFISNFGDTHAAHTKQLCRPEQRDLLLEFKNEFEIPKSRDNCFVNHFYPIPMNSWMYNRDCCDWDGIMCDLKSGEVIKLDLSFSCLHARFDSNTSLFKLINLRFLNTLNLSYNSLRGEVLSLIGSFSHLTSLDLSNNFFSGGIPLSIRNLSRLTSLDLSNNDFSGEISSVTDNLPHLTTLNLFNNHFVGKIPFSVGNLSLLTILSLENNNFDGEIPSSFGSLKRLNVLMLRANNLIGKFPIALLNLTKLSILVISHNHFTGTLPANISSLSNLLYFDASVNSFVGTLPSSLFAISSLRYLDMSNNLLNGTLEFGNVSLSSNLVSLFLGNNNLRGPIPRSISKLVNLVILNISHLSMQGPVDFGIFSHIKRLSQLYLSHLNTTTIIDLNAVLSLHLKSITILDLSGNHVSTTNKSSAANQPFQGLSSLFLSDCGITEFPEILTSREYEMTELDISNNKIKGQVPGSLWKLIDLVNLSNNSFSGFERPTTLAQSANKVTHLFASDNNFTGEIPSFICTLRSLNTLDLSSNNFNGSIPRCMGNLKSNLSRLILRENRLSGSLPENIYGNLISLDVGHNQLVGKLPRSLTQSLPLEVLNVENNAISDSFPFWLSSLQKLQIIVLRSNAFHGPIRKTRFAKLRIMDISHNHFNGTLPSDFFVSWTAMYSLGKNETQQHNNDDKYMGSLYYHDSLVLMNKGVEMELVRILKIYTAIDFSGNKFEGEIPKSIGLLKELHVLNLSSNAFSGHIPSSLANLTALESLDVSQNKLSGGIPQELGSLSYLSHMNFSHNHLAGLVPGGTQFRTQKCSSFENNSGLFGPSLDEACRHTNTSTPQRHETLETEEEDEEVLSWVAAAVGFVPGIIFGFTIGCLLVSYKPEWFMNIFGRSKRRRISTTTR